VTSRNGTVRLGTVAHGAEDVDRYVEVFEEFLREVT
jgi:hypothetical protein